MGCRFSWWASLASFSPYFLLFSQGLELPTSIRHDVKAVICFNDLVMWVQTCEQNDYLFRWVMPMAMENLAIVHHQDILRYATIRE
jgi:hypothetical protein